MNNSRYQEGSDYPLSRKINSKRLLISQEVDEETRSSLGQFLTPFPIARFMAELFSDTDAEIRLLDAGAGIGGLTAAFVENACLGNSKITKISVTAFELDTMLQPHLVKTLEACKTTCREKGIEFASNVIDDDFVIAGVNTIRPGLFSTKQKLSFNRVIMNPPYNKLRKDSPQRSLLRQVGLETDNLYAGFLALAISMLEEGGELVAISPRSFCNGPYFQSFREHLLAHMAFRHIHVFDTRNRAFRTEDVLQETIIFHAVKQVEKNQQVTISTSSDPDEAGMSIWHVRHDQVVKPNDPHFFIHIATNAAAQQVVDRINLFDHTLADLGLAVSTGRVVDFRAEKYLRYSVDNDTAPLIYPHNFEKGVVRWPLKHKKKALAIAIAPETDKLTLPKGDYVVVKRFSSKEQRKRITAALYDSETIQSPVIGFENHLNVFHHNWRGLRRVLSRGLAIYLNATLIDLYFRHFNGHTQVNATDLRILPYPPEEILLRLGQHFLDILPEPRTTDRLLENELRLLSGDLPPDPVAATHNIEDAFAIVKAFGLTRIGQKERSALVLLGLIELKPDISWTEAKNTVKSTEEILDFISQHYGRNYTETAKEAIEKQTMKQLVNSGLVLEHSSSSDASSNETPIPRYQVEPEKFELIRPYRFTERKSQV